MQQFLVILCAASSLVFANVHRGLGHPMRAHSEVGHHHHAHAHFHDGVEHTHWHSHDDGEDHSLPDPESDHHEEISHNDHGDHPFVPAPSLTSVVRNAGGKQLELVQHADVLGQAGLPSLIPAKPPPKTYPHEENLNRLRTVVLLT